MYNGFSFDGIHCDAQGCTYIPTAEDLFNYPDVDVKSTESSCHDGGYFYHSRYKIRKFKLRCFFEDLTREGVQRISLWLSKDKAGKLIFDARPSVYYQVRVSNKFEPVVYVHTLEWMNQQTYSGTFTIEFSAFSPFGYLSHSSYDGIDEYNESSFCGILPAQIMPDAPGVDDKSFKLYNCGNVPCDVTIRLNGTAEDGQTITNKTNGTKCGICYLPPSSDLVIDGEYGRVYVVSGSEETDAFECHEDGYIRLEPCGMVLRDVCVSGNSGEIQVRLTSMEATDSLIGYSIHIGGQWYKICDVLSSGQMILDRSLSSNASGYATIAKMNDIEISGNDYTLSQLTIEYTPKVL